MASKISYALKWLDPFSTPELKTKEKNSCGGCLILFVFPIILGNSYQKVNYIQLPIFGTYFQQLMRKQILHLQLNLRRLRKTVNCNTIYNLVYSLNVTCTNDKGCYIKSTYGGSKAG